MKQLGTSASACAALRSNLDCSSICQTNVNFCSKDLEKQRKLRNREKENKENKENREKDKDKEDMDNQGEKGEQGEQAE